MNWPLWRLEHFAAIEVRHWPSRYMRETLLSEAIWFALSGAKP